jgi:hypothetical protein
VLRRNGIHNAADVLRKARPLYRECAQILNYLPEHSSSVCIVTAKTVPSGDDAEEATSSAATIPNSVFELSVKEGTR